MSEGQSDKAAQQRGHGTVRVRVRVEFIVNGKVRGWSWQGGSPTRSIGIGRRVPASRERKATKAIPAASGSGSGASEGLEGAGCADKLECFASSEGPGPPHVLLRSSGERQVGTYI